MTETRRMGKRKPRSRQPATTDGGKPQIVVTMTKEILAAIEGEMVEEQEFNRSRMIRALIVEALRRRGHTLAADEE